MATKTSKKKETKAAPAKKAAKKGGGGGEVLVVGSKVKNYIKDKDKMSSGDLVDAVSSKVAGLLDAAIARAESNGRKTVKPADL